jgi:hypothetical protein
MVCKYKVANRPIKRSANSSANAAAVPPSITLSTKAVSSGDASVKADFNAR